MDTILAGRLTVWVCLNFHPLSPIIFSLKSYFRLCHVVCARKNCTTCHRQFTTNLPYSCKIENNKILVISTHISGFRLHCHFHIRVYYPLIFSLLCSCLADSFRLLHVIIHLWNSFLLFVLCFSVSHFSYSLSNF